MRPSHHIVGLAFAALMVFSQNMSVSARCSVAAKTGSVEITTPKARLHLQLARSEAQREQGLMARRSLAPGSGMLFLFDDDGPRSFWMKGTLIPLDMVFVGEDKRVRTVFEGVPIAAPALHDDAIPRETGRARYVIELGAGQAKRAGLVSGAKIGFCGNPAL